MTCKPLPPEAAGLPYRPCVGILLLNVEGKAFTGRRVFTAVEGMPPHRWQLPQGGIDPDEDPWMAAQRELREEVGTDAAELLAEYPGWLAYDFPEWVLRRQGSRGFRGQTQKWFALRFTGQETDIRLDAHDPPEFDDWAWRPLEELPGIVVPFKRSVYEALVRHFRPLAREIAQGRAGLG